MTRIETIYPKRRSSGCWSTLFGGGVSGKMSVAYEVSVLRKMDLDLHTTNGRVEVEEVSGEVKVGEVRAHSKNGRIVLRHVEGIWVDLRTHLTAESQRGQRKKQVRV